jgi:hypothetical protein
MEVVLIRKYLIETDYIGVVEKLQNLQFTLDHHTLIGYVFLQIHGDDKYLVYGLDSEWFGALAVRLLEEMVCYAHHPE